MAVSGEDSDRSGDGGGGGGGTVARWRSGGVVGKRWRRWWHGSLRTAELLLRTQGRLGGSAVRGRAANLPLLDQLACVVRHRLSVAVPSVLRLGCVADQAPRPRRALQDDRSQQSLTCFRIANVYQLVYHAFRIWTAWFCNTQPSRWGSPPAVVSTTLNWAIQQTTSSS